MSETNERFTERVDVPPQTDGSFVGTVEIGVRPSGQQNEQIAALQEEDERLRTRVAELERQLAES